MRCKTFRSANDLCKFVNENNLIANHIVTNVIGVLGTEFVLFYD